MNIGNWMDAPCYYVTVADAGRVGWLAGPFRTHADALADVKRARELAEKRDPFAHFYAFGTAKHENGHLTSLFGNLTNAARCEVQL